MASHSHSTSILGILRRATGLRRAVAALSLAAFCLLPLRAESPGWWSARGVLLAGAQPDDYAVLNQGQLKNLAAAAVAEFNEKLAGGAGADLNNLVASWQDGSVPRDDYAAVNLGQLKALAALFYYRLGQPYPWSASTVPADDYALANIGQAKALFSFTVATVFDAMLADPMWQRLQDILNGSFPGYLTAAEYAALLDLLQRMNDAAFIAALQAALAQAAPPLAAQQAAAVLAQAQSAQGQERVANAKPAGPLEIGYRSKNYDFSSYESLQGNYFSGWAFLFNNAGGHELADISDNTNRSAEVISAFQGAPFDLGELATTPQLPSLLLQPNDYLPSAYRIRQYFVDAGDTTELDDETVLELEARREIVPGAGGQLGSQTPVESRAYLVVSECYKSSANPLPPYPAGGHPIEGIGSLTFTKYADGHTKIIPDFGSLPWGVMTVDVLDQKVRLTPRSPEESFFGNFVRLLPMELAPEVLAVNTNFDEGDVDDETHYAKPDCENGTLKAARDHLDGKWDEGDIVTENLHKGFFGLRPGTLPYTETVGAVVKIKKLDKNDPETNRKQSGHVRLYAVWGSEGNESEMKIELYDKDSLVANDIGPQLYHQNPNTPVTFYLEGVEPGKITLEFSYQKGSTSFKHEQEFLVATQQTKDKWLKEIRYQLLLQTNGAVDLDHYLPNNGGWRPRPDPASGASSFVWHKDRVRAIYDYYGQLFEQKPEKLDWTGAARMVGGAVYGGLCDLQASTPSFSVMDELMGGQILIYRDLAWQHRAYVASGIWALEWVDEHDSGSVNGIGGQGALRIEVWREFDGSIQDNNWEGVKDASRGLVFREQSEVIVPMWTAIMNTASGFATIASNEAKNPVDPASPTFRQVVPYGSVLVPPGAPEHQPSVANYPDRDRFSFGWIDKNGVQRPQGVFPVWWGETESSGNPTAFYGALTRLSLVRIPLRTRAALFAQFGTIY